MSDPYIPYHIKEAKRQADIKADIETLYIIANTLDSDELASHAEGWLSKDPSSSAAPCPLVERIALEVIMFLRTPLSHYARHSEKLKSAAELFRKQARAAQVYFDISVNEDEFCHKKLSVFVTDYEDLSLKIHELKSDNYFHFNAGSFDDMTYAVSKGLCALKTIYEARNNTLDSGCEGYDQLAALLLESSIDDFIRGYPHDFLFHDRNSIIKNKTTEEFILFTHIGPEGMISTNIFKDIEDVLPLSSNQSLGRCYLLKRFSGSGEAIECFDDFHDLAAKVRKRNEDAILLSYRDDISEGLTGTLMSSEKPVI